MAEDFQPYEAVLRDLRAKLQKLQTAISALEDLRPVPNGIVMAAAVAPARPVAYYNMEPDGRLKGKTIIEAAMTVLREARGPMHVSDILKGILEGGIPVNSEDQANTVGSVLNRRHREKGDVVRVGRGTWELMAHPLPLRDKGEDGDWQEHTDNLLEVAQ